jgi:hypothetical protein
MFSYLNTFHALPNNSISINRGKLDVDCDPEAELLTVIDRKSLSVIKNQLLMGNSTVSMMLPASYVTGDTVVLMILDNDGEYNASVLDGVTAELVNLR